MKNTLTDLHNHLFETLEALKDPESPMDVDRAKAVCLVADTLMESAKVELKFMEVMGKDEPSQFFRGKQLPQPVEGVRNKELGS
jgi:hypothetical protein